MWCFGCAWHAVLSGVPTEVQKKRHDRSSQIEMSAITLIPQNRRKGKRRRLRQKHGAAECFHQTLDPFCPSLVHPPPPSFSFATVFSFTLHRGVLRRFHVLPLNQALTSPLSLSLPLPSSYLSRSLSLSFAFSLSRSPGFSEMKQELAEEGSRCSILSKQHRFNEHCCIRCCAPFTFLLNPKRQCPDCQYNVCKTCCTYSKRDKAWLCSACQKGRLVFPRRHVHIHTLGRGRGRGD